MSALNLPEDLFPSAATVAANTITSGGATGSEASAATVAVASGHQSRAPATFEEQPTRIQWIVSELFFFRGSSQTKFFPGPTYCGQQTSVSTGVFMTPSRQMVWKSEIRG